MKSLQLPRSQPTVDDVPRDIRIEQLTPRDHPVLTTGDPRNNRDQIRIRHLCDRAGDDGGRAGRGERANSGEGPVRRAGPAQFRRGTGAASEPGSKQDEPQPVDLP